MSVFISELLLILLFQEKTSTIPEESANLSIVAVPRLINVHEDLIGEHGAAGDLAQGAMGTAVTSTPLSSQSVISVPNFDQDQNGTARITRAKYLSHCSSCLLIFLSLI